MTPRGETGNDFGVRPTAEGSATCEDCGAVVADVKVHARFHSILNSHAWALAVLKTSHLAERVHAKWDVVERIDSKTFDNWSADALAEVMGQMGEGPQGGGAGGSECGDDHRHERATERPAPPAPAEDPGVPITSGMTRVPGPAEPGYCMDRLGTHPRGPRCLHP